MSGHSKWSKVKHQKAFTDAVKSQEFTRASRAITVAVREGGGITDPNKNFKLRLAIELARSVNMPKDTIDRAIERGKDSSSQTQATIVYEAYGPGGVGYLVTTITDNHQRTGSQLKHLFEHAGGSFAAPHALEHLFEKDEQARLRSKYPISVASSIRTRNRELIALLTSLDDVKDVVTTMGDE